MGVTRDSQILNIQNQIIELKNQLEFLQDSDTFYDFPLTSSKTVQIIDFNSVNGKTFINSDDTKKLNQEWYKNYSGFLTSEDNEHKLVFNYLKSWTKLYRIHKYIYPAGLPFDNSLLLSEYTFVIKYDTSDANEENWTFVAVDLGSFPDNKDNQFYFNSAANCELAINFMKDSEGGVQDLLSLIHLNI